MIKTEIRIDSDYIEHIINLACQGYYGEAYEEIIKMSCLLSKNWETKILSILGDIDIFKHGS